MFVLGSLAHDVHDIIHCSGGDRTFDKYFHIHDGDRQARMVDQNLWASGYPKRQCTKYPASALVVNKHGYLENFPANARLPVVCSVGECNIIDCIEYGRKIREKATKKNVRNNEEIIVWLRSKQ